MMSQRNPNKRAAETKSNIFIKNLDGSITTKALYDTFSQWGHVVSCKIAETPNGQSRGYGFVNYDNVAAAERAIEAADGMYLYDREM
jgi:polyadenylate-binding protein